MTARETIALTRQTFVRKVMVLLFNTLSRFVIAFLPRSKHLLISWLQSLSAVILESKKIKSVTVSSFFPSILTLCNLNYLSKVLFLSTTILEVITSIHKLGVGDAFSSQRKEKRKNMNEGRKEVI